MSTIDTDKGREDSANWQAPDSGAEVANLYKDRQAQLLTAENGWRKVEAPNFDDQGRANVRDIKGTYNKHNNEIAVVDSQGNKFIAPWTSDLETQVRNAGLEYNESMNVA